MSERTPLPAEMELAANEAEISKLEKKVETPPMHNEIMDVYKGGDSSTRIEIAKQAAMGAFKTLGIENLADAKELGKGQIVEEQSFSAAPQVFYRLKEKTGFWGKMKGEKEYEDDVVVYVRLNNGNRDPEKQTVIVAQVKQVKGVPQWDDSRNLYKVASETDVDAALEPGVVRNRFGLTDQWMRGELTVDEFRTGYKRQHGGRSLEQDWDGHNNKGHPLERWVSEKNREDLLARLNGEYAENLQKARDEAAGLHQQAAKELREYYNTRGAAARELMTFAEEHMGQGLSDAQIISELSILRDAYGLSVEDLSAAETLFGARAKKVKRENEKEDAGQAPTKQARQVAQDEANKAAETRAQKAEGAVKNLTESQAELLKTIQTLQLNLTEALKKADEASAREAKERREFEERMAKQLADAQKAADERVDRAEESFRAQMDAFAEGVRRSLSGEKPEGESVGEAGGGAETKKAPEAPEEAKAAGQQVVEGTATVVLEAQPETQPGAGGNGNTKPEETPPPEAII